MRYDVLLNVLYCEELSTTECTSAVQMDSVKREPNPGYKCPSECSNGFSKRILEESSASITPYFRQASMKSAARSKYRMLPGRWMEEDKDTGMRR